MNQRKFYLFRIDMKYVRDLHNVDSRVISVSPQLHKEKRVFLGIVVLCNSREYIIPLSHPKEKHQKMKSKADFDKIVNKNGKLLGVLNYNLMIPVNNTQIQKFNFNIHPSDSPEMVHYKNLCREELLWCRKNHEMIMNKANVLYELCTSDSNYKGKSRCLDFKKLEQVCDRYNEKQ